MIFVNYYFWIWFNDFLEPELESCLVKPSALIYLDEEAGTYPGRGLIRRIASEKIRTWKGIFVRRTALSKWRGFI